MDSWGEPRTLAACVPFESTRATLVLAAAGEAKRLAVVRMRGRCRCGCGAETRGAAANGLLEHTRMPAGNDHELMEIAAALVPLATEGCTIDLGELDKLVCVAASHVDRVKERALYTLEGRAAHRAQSRCAVRCDGKTVGEVVAWSERALPPLAEALVCSAAAHVGAVLEARSERRRAELAEVARGAIISMVGHEVRAPLQTLVLGLELVQMRVRDSADELPRAWLVDRCVQLTRAAGRLTGVAERLLDISRHEAGVVHLERAPDDAAAIVEAVVGRVRDDADWVSCRIDLLTEGSLLGRWDRVHLETVIENLLTNAMKYGAGRPVSVRVTGGSDDVVIEVRDRGCGILPEDQPRVFDRFFRGTVSGHHAGLGVGLWIVKRLVDAHRGTIVCESSPGRGSTFRVRLPREVTGARWSAAPSGWPPEEPER